MDATMPMFMLKRTGRAAEFAGLEEAGAAEPELAGAVADVAEETALTVVPKPVGADGVDIGVPRLKKTCMGTSVARGIYKTYRVDKETEVVAAEVTLRAEVEEMVVLAVVPVTTEPIVNEGDSARTC